MAATTSCDTTPADSTTNPPHQKPDVPLKPLDKLPVSIVAQRRIVKSGAVGTPVRRSPRLSCLPPSQPPVGCQDTGSDDGSDSVNDFTLYRSREHTPESDILPPDEPSTVLANKILRAHDNPSPPPEDLGRLGADYVPGKDGQFPSHAISVPPSPFRPINLLERLDQLSYFPFDPSGCLQTLTSGDQPGKSQSSIRPAHGSVAPDSSPPFVTPVPMESAAHESQKPDNKLPTQLSFDCLSRSSQHVCEPNSTADGVAAIHPAAGSHEQLTTITASLPTELPDPFPTLPASDVCSVVLFSSSGQQSRSESLPLTRDATTQSPLPLIKGVETSLPTITSNDGKEFLSEDHSNLLILEEPQESKCTRDDANLHQRLNSPSHVINVLSEPVEPTTLPTKSTPIGRRPVTLHQSPRSSKVPPDFSRSTVQRPIITPTRIRPNNYISETISPVKFSSEHNDIRTPAQRVPIGTALARGTASYQKALQLSDCFHPGRLPAIRAPVFTRPALDDPCRSPAKRIPIKDSTTSPSRGNQSQNSPMRFDPRARSASAEQPPIGPTVVRSRSAEPCAAIPKPDSHERPKESIFPVAPFPQRSLTKLPFPLVPGQKLICDLPLPVPEENETTETAKGAGHTLDSVKQKSSQLRQQSANSRIPRIGNKPYARPPPNNRKATTAPTRVAKGSSFQPICKNNGVTNNSVEVTSTRHSNDLLLVGSLKRKRETTAPSNSHPVMVRQVVPGMLSGKYAPKHAKNPSQVQTPLVLSPPKITQPLKFRKVVDGMLSARYPPKTNPVQMVEPILSPPSPLSELSSSSNEEPCDEKLAADVQSPSHSQSEPPDLPSDRGAPTLEPNTHDRPSSHQKANSREPSGRPRRASRKATQPQDVSDIFNSNTSTRPPTRRKPPSRTEGDGFMGMSATALKALTTSNTTKNQQTVAVLATEVIRREGLRPESPAVKARTILQKQHDERDTRRRERAQRKARMSDGVSANGDTEGEGVPISLGWRADHIQNDYATSQKHCRGPGDEEDYETPERPERMIEALKLEGNDRKVKPVKQVKWHRGLSTAVYLDEVNLGPKPLPKNIAMRGCLASTSKGLALDPLGNLVDIDHRPCPELVTEQIVVKKYLYDNDIEPTPTTPAKITRSKSKKK